MTGRHLFSPLVEVRFHGTERLLNATAGFERQENAPIPCLLCGHVRREARDQARIVSPYRTAVLKHDGIKLDGDVEGVEDVATADFFNPFHPAAARDNPSAPWQNGPFIAAHELITADGRGMLVLCAARRPPIA